MRLAGAVVCLHGGPQVTPVVRYRDNVYHIMYCQRQSIHSRHFWNTCAADKSDSWKLNAIYMSQYLLITLVAVWCSRLSVCVCPYDNFWIKWFLRSVFDTVVRVDPVWVKSVGQGHRSKLEVTGSKLFLLAKRWKRNWENSFTAVRAGWQTWWKSRSEVETVNK